MMDQLRVRGYGRVSSDEQRDRETILTQTHDLGKDAQRENMPLQKIYLDDGVSGTIPFKLRPEGRQVFGDARRSEFDVLKVTKLDRIGRDTLDILTTIAELKKLGVHVRSITQPTADDPNGQLMKEILASFSSFERTMITDRTRNASRRLATEGVWLGGIVPYGYRTQGVKKECRLVLSEDSIPGCDFSEAWVIRRIYRLAADGKTCVFVARYLRRLSVPTRYIQDGREVLRGKRKERTSGVWTPGRVRNIIVNPTYKGIHEYGKRKTHRGEDGRMKYKALPKEQWIIRACPAIVEVELWERANAALHANQIIAMGHAKYQYLLRGKIKCGRCGLAFIGTKASGRNSRFYYKCNGKMGSRGEYGIRGETCPSPSLPGHDLEAMVWEDLRQFLAQPGKVIEQLEEQMKSLPENDSQIQDLEAAIQRQEAKRQRWLEQYAEGLITRNERDERLAAVMAAKEQSEKALIQARKLAADVQARTGSLASAYELLDKLRDGLIEKMPFEKRRRIVEALVEWITVTVENQRPKVQVVYRFDPHFTRYTDGWLPGGNTTGPGTEGALSYLPTDSWPR